MDADSKELVVNEIGNFVEATEKTLNDVLNRLGWTVDHVLATDDSKVVVCPFDKGHRMPIASLDHHLEACSWLRDGYTKEDLMKAPPDPGFCYKNCANVVSVSVDEQLQAKIVQSVVAPSGGYLEVKKGDRDVCKVPRTVERATVDFTRDERLAIYDYVINEARNARRTDFNLEKLPINFGKQEEHDRPKTRIEILAEQRDYKRRRQSYRAKNVHITKKSYTEVMREVIQQQMEYLNPDLADGTSSEKLEVDNQERSGNRRGRNEHGMESRRHSDSSRHSRKRSRSPSVKHERNRNGDGRDSRSSERQNRDKHGKSHDFSEDSGSRKMRHDRIPDGSSSLKYRSTRGSDDGSGSASSSANGHRHRKHRHKSHKHKDHRHSSRHRH